MAEDDVTRAGAVILKDLALFNQSTVFFEQQIDPKIRTVFGELVKQWIEENFWIGDADVSEGFCRMWLCPRVWKEGEDSAPLARFWFYYHDESATNSYEVADLFGQGETTFGFWFEAEHSWYGGKQEWNKFVQTIGAQTQAIMQSPHGWIDKGKGEFFRPVVLDAQHLVSAWENDDWGLAMAPLLSALDELVADQKLFDAVIFKANLRTA